MKIPRGEGGESGDPPNNLKDFFRWAEKHLIKWKRFSNRSGRVWPPTLFNHTGKGHFGVFEAILRPFWPLFWPILTRVDAILRHLEPDWAHFDTGWPFFNHILTLLEPILTHFDSVWNRFCPILTLLRQCKKRKANKFGRKRSLGTLFRPNLAN